MTQALLPEFYPSEGMLTPKRFQVHGNSITRLAAAAHTWDPVIQRVQCLNCCIRYAVDAGLKHITIIMGQHYITAMKYNESKRRAEAQINGNSNTN
jgi:hypothetical protein